MDDNFMTDPTVLKGKTTAATDIFIYFDVSDFVYFIGHHDNLTGIQRVQAEIILALTERHGIEYHFVSFMHGKDAFVGIDRDYLVSVIEDLKLPLEFRSVTVDKNAARGGYIGPAKSQPLATIPVQSRSVICLLGAAWVNQNYSLHIQNMRRLYGARFVGLIHDLIPIYAKESCDQGTAEVFQDFIEQFLSYCDGILAVSQNTKNDILKYIADSGTDYAGDISVTQNGSGLSTKMIRPALEQALAQDNKYILFVSTIEGRKNHILAFRALKKILDRRGDAPRLICVGRVGWRAEDFLKACYSTNFLDGRIQVLQDISDSELEELYRGSKFTVYPSYYEGWGLPIGEALEHGKVVIAADSSSLPEVGGESVVYFKCGDVEEFANAIEKNFYDEKHFSKNLARARKWIPTPWATIAERVVSACASVTRQPLSRIYPKLEVGKEYPLRLIPKISASLNGEALATSVRQSRARRLTSGSFSDSDARLGLDARLGRGWCAAENGRTWISPRGGDLIFELDDENDEPMIYIAYERAQFMERAYVAVTASGGEVVSLEEPSPSGIITVPRLKRINTSHGKYFSVSFAFKIPEADLALARDLDPRVPVLGIKGFLNVRRSDVELRMSVLERALNSPHGAYRT